MHILQISKLYPPYVGGVETVVKQYSQYLKNQGHQVTVLTAQSHPSLRTSREVINGVTVIRCSSLINIYSMPFSFSLFYHFIKIIRKIDIIHVHEPYPLGTLLGIVASPFKKVVVTWHSDIVRQKWSKAFLGFFQSLLCSRAAIITVTSPKMVESSCILRRKKLSCEVLPLSIPLDEYNVPVARLSFLMPLPYVLFLGRLSHYKGIPYFLDAISQTEDLGGVAFVIAGSGELSDYVTCRIKDFTNTRVIFFNRAVSDEEKKDLLAHCLFFVFPSTMRNEAFGIIQLEAMAYGKPVINTNLPTGVPWVSVHGETGLTVPPCDSKSLAKAIRCLVVDDDLRGRLGKAARNRVKSAFFDETVLPGLLRIYERLQGE
jgi:rhamnosyl/mannosyltransferase